MARGRSPNYPSLNINEAVDRAKKVYGKEHLHQVPKQVVAEDLGYTSLNGASLTAIGALRRYGLLEAAGDGLRVTKDAVTLIELTAMEPSYLDTLKKIAFTPELFQQLRDELGSNLPSESTLRHNLINKGFLPQAADEVIRVYRENIQIVSVASGQYTRATADEISQNNNANRLSAMESGPTGPTSASASIWPSSGATGPTGQAGGWISSGSKLFGPSVLTSEGPTAGNQAAMNQDVFTLTEGNAIIQWPKSLSEDSYTDFVDWLELIKRKAKRAAAAEKRLAFGDLKNYSTDTDTD